jgi:hypothetical protein
MGEVVAVDPVIAMVPVIAGMPRRGPNASWLDRQPKDSGQS